MTRSGGHGFAALGRRELLAILQQRAAELGVEVLFEREAPPLAELGWADLIVAADGASSAVRAALAADVRPITRPAHVPLHVARDRPRVRRVQVLHRGDATRRLPGARLPVRRPMSTFIVETTRSMARGRARDRPASTAPGESDEQRRRVLPRAVRRRTPGPPLFANNSKWINFITVRNGHWCADNVVLIGDAAHTAHFSIGRGRSSRWRTRSRSRRALRTSGTPVGDALAAYEAERRPIAERTQRAAQASLEWFEGLGRYVEQEPRTQFAFNLLTRSRGITYENLRLRDPAFVASVDSDFARRTGGLVAAAADVPTAARCAAGAPNRVVVSPMDMYQLGRRDPRRLPSRPPRLTRARRRRARHDRDDLRLGDGRITPGCAGMYRDEHIGGVAADRRLRRTRTAVARSGPSSATPGARGRRS